VAKWERASGDVNMTLTDVCCRVRCRHLELGYATSQRMSCQDVSYTKLCAWLRDAMRTLSQDNYVLSRVAMDAGVISEAIVLLFPTSESLRPAA
jgi:hypothetical protein